MSSYPALVSQIANGLVTLVVDVEGQNYVVTVPIEMCEWADEDQRVMMDMFENNKMLNIRPIEHLQLDEAEKAILEKFVDSLEEI